MSWCVETYVSGWKRGKPCRFRASAIVKIGGRTFTVCGYHARQYSSSVVYPFDWNLQRIRHWQVRNLLGVTGG